VEHDTKCYTGRRYFGLAMKLPVGYTCKLYRYLAG